jgi:hypothetical protein
VRVQGTLQERLGVRVQGTLRVRVQGTEGEGLGNTPGKAGGEGPGHCPGTLGMPDLVTLSDAAGGIFVSTKVDPATEPVPL